MFKKVFKGINHKLLWPALSLTAIVLTISFIDKDFFVSMCKGAKSTMLGIFGGTASLVALFCVITVVSVYFSPLGKVRIGGKDAKPIMGKWNWFSITLCTTIATGCVFWGIVQPMIHIDQPAAMWGVEPHSAGAIINSMATIFLQWTVQPYGIYCLPVLMFAFVYYNMKQPYGIVSTFVPVFGEKASRKMFTPVNSILLFAVIIGIASSCAQGMFNLSGAAAYNFGWAVSPTLYLWIGVAMILPAVISSITGILKGIRVLSDINFKVYILIVLFIAIAGNIGFMLNLGIESAGQFGSTYLQQSLATGTASGDLWAQDWLNYNNACWMCSIAIAPIFLGSLARGRTIKEVIKCNFVWPVIFSFVWMTILAGNTIYQDLQSGGELTTIMNEMGTQFLPYEVFGRMKFGEIAMWLYIIAVFISFVTFVDSSLTAISTLSVTHPYSKGDTVEENKKAGVFIKIFVGFAILVMTWVLVSYADIEGAKILANLAAWPAMVIEIILIFGAFKIMRNPNKFNYIDNGRPKSTEKQKKKMKWYEYIITPKI